MEALGEVAALKDNLNEMIVNLAATTRKNTDQDWLKTNIAKFTRMVQGQRDLLTVAQLLLSELAPLVSAQRGTLLYRRKRRRRQRRSEVHGRICFRRPGRSSRAIPVRSGTGGPVRAARNSAFWCAMFPEITSGSVPAWVRALRLTIVVLPVLFEGEVKAVVELASFHNLSEIHVAFLDQLTESIGIVLNTIAATMRTEQLLQQSQALAEELQNTNARVAGKGSSCWRSKTPKSRPRIAKSSRPNTRWKKRPSSLR